MKQREIKFRAWDNNLRSMIEIFTLYNDGTGSVIPQTDQHSSTTGSERYEIMQFTGLHDKNGKEIYEGDLFACIYKFDGHKDHIYEVYYDEMHGRFGLQRHGNPCSQYEVIKELIDVARYPKLGNIYENPDLLK